MDDWENNPFWWDEEMFEAGEFTPSEAQQLYEDGMITHAQLVAYLTRDNIPAERQIAWSDSCMFWVGLLFGFFILLMLVIGG